MPCHQNIQCRIEIGIYLTTTGSTVEESSRGSFVVVRAAAVAACPAGVLWWHKKHYAANPRQAVARLPSKPESLIWNGFVQSSFFTDSMSELCGRAVAVSEVTKYRRGVFTNEILDDLKPIFASVCAEFKAEPVGLDGEDDMCTSR